jgi:hypothetical protein
LLNLGSPQCLWWGFLASVAALHFKTPLPCEVPQQRCVLIRVPLPTSLLALACRAGGPAAWPFVPAGGTCTHEAGSGEKLLVKPLSSVSQQGTLISNVGRPGM